MKTDISFSKLLFLSGPVLQFFKDQVINTVAISSPGIISTAFFKKYKYLISFFRVGEKDVLFLYCLQFLPFYYIFLAFLYYIGYLHVIYMLNIIHSCFFYCLCISVGVFTLHY